MSKLPNLEKNAYLTIYIKDFYIKADLVYSDFNISRHYILTDLLEHIHEDMLVDTHFWGEYFTKLEDIFGWEILHKGNHTLMHFGGESIGLYGVDVIIDSRFFEPSKIIDAIRLFNQDLSIKVINRDYIERYLAKVKNKLEYDDILLLDLNLKSNYVYRYNTVQKKINLLSPATSKPQLSSGQIAWQSVLGLMDIVTDYRLTAFLSTEDSKETVVNKWSNFVLNYSLSQTNELVRDILKSLIITNLLSIRNDNRPNFENFGFQKKKSVILVTGSLLKNITQKLLLLSLIDGLELAGDIDVIFDENMNFLTLGDTYLDGSINSKYIVGKEDIFKYITKIIIPTDMPEFKARKVIFDAEIFRENVSSGKLFAFSDEISFINLTGEGDFYMTGKYVNNVSVYDESDFEYVSSVEKKEYSSLVVDGRKKPIVYGPGARNNRLKLNQWLNEESIQIS